MNISPFNWNCPHCGMSQTVTKENHKIICESLDTNYITSSEYNTLNGIYEKIKCANPLCNKITINSCIEENEIRGVQTSPTTTSYRVTKTNVILNKRLIPNSEAKVLPPFIPNAIKDDYYEACLIKDLSPKASATLIRRCLQGMIRDFCGITKSTLFNEISELKSQVNSNTAPREISIESVDAIDATRKIGNIGAHMEKDVNEIIDVEPNEAQCLIELVETLLDDWYIARENRKQRFSNPIEIKDNKEAMRQNNN